MVYKVIGKRGMLIADLHLSDVYQGKHRNYLANCFEILGKILQRVEDDKPDYIAFLGDLVGLRDKLIQDRKVLLQVCTFFRRLNTLTNGNVFSVRGNHDNGEFPEFSYLEGMGLIKTANTIGDCFDVFIHEDDIEPELRFHIVDYGQERKRLNLCTCENTSNIVLGHNNYTVNGLTNWYYSKDGIELSTLDNFVGIDVVFSGHIHLPSPYTITTAMRDGRECALFYLGCPTRPNLDQGEYSQVYTVSFTYREDELSGYTDWKADVLELAPKEEVFFADATFIEEKTEDEILEDVRKKNLSTLLHEIMDSRMTSGDLITQIESIPNATNEAREIAKSYIQMAIDSVKSKQ